MFAAFRENLSEFAVMLLAFGTKLVPRFKKNQKKKNHRAATMPGSLLFCAMMFFQSETLLNNRIYSAALGPPCRVSVITDVNLFSLTQCKQVIKILFSNWGACPWSPLAFFSEWRPFSHSHPFLCPDRWSLTPSGTPAVKHPGPNLWEPGGQCVGSLVATETWMMTVMKSAPVSWLLWHFL